MAVLHALAAIGRFIRRTPPPPADLLDAYAHEVIPVLDRAEWLYQYWLEQSTLFTDSEKLGNVAAIHRWEIATMGRSLERVIPPAALASAHEQVLDALEMASRAAQLLSNGSRFHNANAVCEGHAMLAASRERRLDALRSMRRYLARTRPAADPRTDPASSEMPAEAAALVAPRDDAPADTSPQDGPASDGEAAEGEPPVGAADADLDLILADPAEPEPAWLSAARRAADHSETRADRPGEQSEAPEHRSAEQVASAEAVDAPADTTVDERSPGPPERDGWGTLFAKPPEQPDR